MDKPLEVELDSKQYERCDFTFLKRPCSNPDVVFYLQVGNIRLSLDHSRWKSHEVTQLLEDTKLLLDHTYCEDWHMRTLYDLATALYNTELLILLIKKGFQIDKETVSYTIGVTKDLIDVLIEQGETKSVLTELVYNSRDGGLELFEHLDNKIGIDLEYFYKKSQRLFYSSHLDLLRFIFQKIVNATENFDIHTFVTEDNFLHGAVCILQILVDEFGLNPRNYINAMLERLKCFEADTSFYLFSFPYIEQHIGLFDMKRVRSTRSYHVVRTCAYLLSLGADFHIIKENLELAYPDGCETIDYSSRFENRFSLKYSKILKKRLLDFFEQRVVTNRDSQELYNECCKFIDDKLSMEMTVSDIVNTNCFYEWKDDYLHYARGVGIHIYIADTKIQVLEKYDEDILGHNKLFKRFRKIFHSVSDIIDSEKVTQEDKDALLIICFNSPMPSGDEAIKNRTICSDFIQDYTNTIILLLQHRADINIIKSVKHRFDTLDITRGSETLVDIMIETDPRVFEPIFISAVNHRYVNIVEYILQKYPDEVTFSLVQKSRFIHHHKITMLVVYHLIAKCDVEDTKK